MYYLRKTGALFLLFIFLSNQSVGQSTEAFFATEPTLSPNADYIIFSFESDLWKVSINGGVATRLTAMDGMEQAANISPDGKWLVFSSDQFGNYDIYLMPLDGGEIQRLTYHQANDQVSSWAWDSESIYFTSTRYNRTSTYQVSIEGGTPARLFGHYHNTIHNVIEHPSDNMYYFNESWESLYNSDRKGYKGAFNPNIKSYNTDSKEYVEHTTWIGQDMWPMIDREGNFYFVSDEENDEYNLYTLNNGNPQPLTYFDTSVKSPKISADGSHIVFEREYQLFVYDITEGVANKVPIMVPWNDMLTQNQSFQAEGNVTGMDVSVDGNKLAFISRGELFVSDMEGKFIRHISTASMGRVLEVKWLADNKTLLFNQTFEGYQNLYTIAADGSSEEIQRTSDLRNNRNIELNSDRTKAIYHSGRDALMLMDLENFNSSMIVQDEFWGFQNTQPRFSPNDEYVIYNAKRNFEQEIFTYEISTGSILNLTNTGISEFSPSFSPDGKYVYYSSTEITPSYPRGIGDFDLFRIALDRYDAPFRTKKFDELFTEEESETDAEEEAEEKDEEIVEITINTDRIMERAERVGPQFGNQFIQVVVAEGDKTMVIYSSNHDEANTGLYVTTLEPFEDPKTTKIDGINQAQRVIVSGGKAYAISRGSIYSLNPGASSAKKIETNISFSRNLKDEFHQMFDEFWANIEENFYNETFHNIDWQTIRDRYRTYLLHVTNRNDFRRMNNDMIGELNSSHLGFNSSGPEENKFYSTFTASTGLLFENDNPYVVSNIIRRGASDITGKNIQIGDELIAVNGTPVNTSMNREYYFSFPHTISELTLTFKRGRNEHTVHLHPTNYFATRNALYDEWIDTNQQIVDEQTEQRVAYVHMKNMGSFALQTFLKEMTSEAYTRDALILDLRFNTGGNVHDDVLRFLSQRAYAQWKYREAEFTKQSNFTPADKPIILLINEVSLSDAELTSAGFKELGLGTIVGTETYRWIIFTSGKSLVDGSFYRLPKVGVYDLDGTNLELTGVSPDIEVRNTFKDRISGQDPQLMKAIELAVEQLED